MAKSMASSTMIPAAAFTWKPAWGRETQLKIWMGSTVKGVRRASREAGGR